MEIDLSQTPEQQIKIIRAICVFQLDSLKRILNDEMEPFEDGTQIDITMFLIENEVEKNELQELLEYRIKLFGDLHDNPDDLRVLSKEDLSMFRHLLSNLEDEWRDIYPNAVRNLWKRLFLIEDIQGEKYTMHQLN